MADYPFNAKFPPKDGSKNNLYHGYDTAAEECLFYDFAVQGYDLKISYNNVSYYFMTDVDCVWLSDDCFSAMVKRFENGNDVLLNFLLDGKPLYSMVNQLDDCEVM